MLSVPLQQLYTGDFYHSDPNPLEDGYLIEPMLFNVLNPQTLQTSEYKWTGSFNKADHKFEAGQGFALWVDKVGTNYTNHDPVTFSFPKPDTYYYYYNPIGGDCIGQTGTLDRDKSHRLFSDGLKNNGSLELAATGSSGSGDTHPVLVGNPFMSHVDFN